jgi:hypothetical protein
MVREFERRPFEEEVYRRQQEILEALYADPARLGFPPEDIVAIEKYALILARREIGMLASSPAFQIDRILAMVQETIQGTQEIADSQQWEIILARLKLREAEGLAKASPVKPHNAIMSFSNFSLPVAERVMQAFGIIGDVNLETVVANTPKTDENTKYLCPTFDIRGIKTLIEGVRAQAIYYLLNEQTSRYNFSHRDPSIRPNTVGIQLTLSGYASRRLYTTPFLPPLPLTG